MERTDHATNGLTRIVCSVSSVCCILVGSLKFVNNDDLGVTRVVYNREYNIIQTS